MSLEEVIDKGAIGEKERKIIAERILISAIEQKKGFCMWRMPMQKEVSFMVGEVHNYQVEKDEIEALGTGFVVQPFTKEKPGYFINADKHMTVLENGSCEGKEAFKDCFSRETKHAKLSWKSFEADKRSPLSSAVEDQLESNKAYQTLVEHSIEYIQSGAAQKIVPARKKDIPLPADFSPMQLMESMIAKYTNAFVYIYYLPEVGFWSGATPETLIATLKNDVFETVALAGTQSYNTGQSLKAVAWTQKEIEEQALVSRYIINCFKAIRLREFSEEGPKTVRAGALIHLKTKFKVDLKETDFFNLGTTMLRLLHPTSAICGMPLQGAENFIRKNENLDRKFFSGFLGPVNFKKDTRIFVNLRCMEIVSPETARVYAGAGVTEDSEPEKEWNETEMKMNTILNMISFERGY